MRIVCSLLFAAVSTSSFALQLPKKTIKKTEFVSASSTLSTQEDFYGKEEEYKNLALEVRNNPSVIDEYAYEMVQNEDPSQRKDLEIYVAGELKKEALARQYVLLIDKSLSMTSFDQDGGRRGDRWGAAQEVCKNLVDSMFRHDIDHKVPTYLFGDRVEDIGELTDPQQVYALFRDHSPDGRSTNLSGALDLALQDHVGKMRNNFEVIPGTTVVVVTDGQPNNEFNVEQVLKKYANPRNGFVDNDEQLAISFIQVGDDRGASDFLQKMDRGFKFNGRKMDICDTKKDNDVRRFGCDKVLEDAIFD